MKILRSHHVLAVHDARSSARYFVDSLGFRIVHEDPGWVFVQRDHCMIMLGECRDDMSPGELAVSSAGQFPARNSRVAAVLLAATRVALPCYGVTTTVRTSERSPTCSRA